MGKTLNDLYAGIYDIARVVTQKGGTINSSNISPSFEDIKNGINSIPYAPTTLNGVANVVLAEMPNVTIKMETESGVLVDSKTTNATNGGSVSFSVTTYGNYRFTAYDSENNQLWTKLFGVPSGGIYNCKVGKPFADYTDEEVNKAAKNDYAKIMWSVEDERTTTIMGTSKKIHIADFNHYKKTDGTGYCGLVLEMNDYTSSGYKHNNTNDNTIGWEGSLIRQNGLADGDYYYTRATVDETTTGTYYAHDELTNVWNEKTLPADYDTEEYYYTRNTKSGDGAFLTGIPAFKDYIVQVETATADAGLKYKKIIISKDRVFTPSDGEVFGNSKRYSSRYSQYEKEGQQLDYYKNNYSDGKIRSSGNWWLRSPSSGSDTFFCCVSGIGYVTNDSASNTYCVRLVFCL